MASRASRMATLRPGHSRRRWQAAPTPERPAPTISTSTCSTVSFMRSRYRHGVESVNALLSLVRASGSVAGMSSPARSATRSARGRRATRPSGDDREGAILATLERLLGERALSEISTDDLARGAGISRPTFYFYFPSKDAVLLALLDRVVTEADAALDRVPDDLASDPPTYWRNCIAPFYETFRG